MKLRFLVSMIWADSDVKVTWDGEDDPNDPYNWSQAFRLLTTLSLSCGGLVNTMSTSMVAPSLPQISKDLHIGTFTTQLTMSVYLLAYVFAPSLLHRSRKCMEEGLRTSSAMRSIFSSIRSAPLGNQRVS
jgi:hypothetical protein